MPKSLTKKQKSRYGYNKWSSLNRSQAKAIDHSARGKLIKLNKSVIFQGGNTEKLPAGQRAGQSAGTITADICKDFPAHEAEWT